jgi:hypothetical protein
MYILRAHKKNVDIYDLITRITNFNRKWLFNASFFLYNNQRETQLG